MKNSRNYKTSDPDSHRDDDDVDEDDDDDDEITPKKPIRHDALRQNDIDLLSTHSKSSEPERNVESSGLLFSTEDLMSIQREIDALTHIVDSVEVDDGKDDKPYPAELKRMLQREFIKQNS